MRNSSEPAGQGGVFIMPLNGVSREDLRRVGSKAGHLGDLIAAKLPVPSGFVVTTEAYLRFIDSEPGLNDWLKSLHFDPADLRGKVEQLRQRLSTLAVPAEVAESIASGLASKPGAAWAVRSSGTFEDLPDASFAGQYDSFLNILGRDAVMAAVKQCWLSLFSERTISYRMRKGLALHEAQMAVIVQELVPAQAGGVMFTVDPTGRESDCILIEATFGLGDAVVQGKVSADSIVLSRSPLRVVRRRACLKGAQIVPGDNGAREETIPAGKENAMVLDDPTALRLAGLGLETERLFGVRVDVEWCLCNGCLWLLQARPATAAPARAQASFEDRQVWTNANTGEVLPDVVTPMTWSLLLPLLRSLYGRLLWGIGVKIDQEQVVRLIAGRAYFNVNTLHALGRRIPGVKNRWMDRLMGGRQDLLATLGKIQMTDANLPPVKIHYGRAAIGIPAMLLRTVFFSTDQCAAAVESIRRFNDSLAHIQPGSLSDEELVAIIQTEAAQEISKAHKTVDALGVELAYPVYLYSFCERWFGPEGATIANRLLAAVGDLDSAATGHVLWLLAEHAAGDLEIKTLLFSERNFGAFASRIRNCPSGPVFLARWEAFMDRHGHHTRGEIELSNPRWSECPDFILQTVRRYVEAIDAHQSNPIDRADALAQARIALANDCLAKLGNPLKRALFRLVLHRAQKGTQFRENIKSELVRWFAVMRQWLLELGRRWTAQGRLAAADDIFFLQIEELCRGIGKPTTNLPAIIAERRAVHERNQRITPPSIIIGRFDPESLNAEAVDYSTQILHGLGVSAGVIAGRARVILRTDTDEIVQPGEILVAPFTDPGWTPFFLGAAGIVVDQGGMLSHGSIIAREYGIPAVVNVGPATQIIRTGQLLEVDADHGIVKLVEERPKAHNSSKFQSGK